jgi:hypothetical protein
MNKKTLAVIIIALFAYILLYMHSFGPLAKSRKLAGFNPASSKPSMNVSGKKEFHNKDIKEDYYHIVFPADWNVSKGAAPGSYSFSYKKLSGTAELTDVPDNSTLELFVLSREEPKLEKQLVSYKRLDYVKANNGGDGPYTLTYSFKSNGALTVASKIYIPGSDMGGVITVSFNNYTLAEIKPVTDMLEKSFVWENAK